MLKDFSKGGSDKSVYGVFTRDYRINALEARILVTVPACLEILLFSPAHRNWVNQLRYVIFDEVHCMREGGIREGGAAESTGTIWEHCLLLIRCYTHAMLLGASHTLMLCDVAKLAVSQYANIAASKEMFWLLANLTVEMWIAAHDFAVLAYPVCNCLTAHMRH